jgi:ADP-ribose pyrophosphatase YjhB (NUDIX family)
MYRYNFCQNCGFKGHHIRDCKKPKTSLGIILYKKIQNSYKYLMVRRRNSIGYVEFIRGRYAFNDIIYIQQLFNVMTDYEINLIQDKNFEYLWEYLWLDKLFKKSSDKLKKDFLFAFNKYDKLKKGYINKCCTLNLNFFILNKTSNYAEQEWGFPKGRRNLSENNLTAALRELEEETNIYKNDINLINEFDLNFIEEYKSYDNIKYKNIYFLGEFISDKKMFIDNKKKEQYTEISKIKFFTLKECLSKIRNYNIEKKKILQSVNNFILTNIKK